MARAVYMTAEVSALLREFAIMAQRKHLEAAAVGEYGPVPAVELMQASGAI